MDKCNFEGYSCLVSCDQCFLSQKSSFYALENSKHSFCTCFRKLKHSFYTCIQEDNQSIIGLPSPPSSSLCTTALTLEASSPTELCRILFATSSPLSADSTTTGRRSAIRAHDWSSYVHLSLEE